MAKKQRTRSRRGFAVLARIVRVNKGRWGKKRKGPKKLAVRTNRSTAAEAKC